MKTVLYFEEYVSPLSEKIQKHDDINVVILIAKKTIGKYISIDELNKINVPYYIFDTENDFTIEMGKFKRWLDSQNLVIDYLLNDSEYYLAFSNKVGRELEIEALTEEQVNWVRDKVHMKDKFNEIGFTTVNYSPVNSKDEILEFYVRNNCQTIIFKPRDAMNSYQVYKIDSIEDINNLEINFASGKFMVETYCPYQEWSIESLVQDGKVIDSFITYIPNRTLWASINNELNCHMTVPKIPSFFKFVPKDFIQKIVDGMNLKNGAMTIEVFIDNDGYVIPSELGWRLPGCQATTNHGKSYGFDMYEALIDIAIHKRVSLVYKDKISSVGDLYLPNKAGFITKITSLEELLEMDGVIDGQMFIKVGDIQTKRRVGNDASGWVQVEGKDEIDTLKKMQYIYENFVIETQIGKDVKRYVKKV